MRLTTAFLIVLMMTYGLTDSGEPAMPLEITGAKIASEEQARHFAFKHYVERMKVNILAEESVRTVAIIKVGYDISGFAKKGDLIWDTRVLALENELRGIIWVHPGTEKVLFITGAWDQRERSIPPKTTHETTER